MKKRNRACRWEFLLGTKAMKRWECLVIFALIMILIVSYGYNDTIFLIRHGMNVWGSIFEGDGLFSFYTYNHMQAVQQQDLGILACDAMYDFPIYFIMAIWNFPLWVIHSVTNIDVAATWWGILYGKLLFVIFLYIGALIIKEICVLLEIPEYKANWAPIIYLTSLITISSVYIIGQCDSIGIVFVLGGICYYLKNDRQKFLLCFSFAISMKFFGILIFAVLLVAREKRVLYIVRDFLAGLGITVLSRILFSRASLVGNNIKDDFSANMLQIVLQNKIPLLNGTVPVSVSLVCIVIAFCYLMREQKKEKMIWWIFVINFVFFASFEGTPYWYMYLGTAATLLMVLTVDCEKENVLFLTLGEAALTLGHYIRYYWCYDVDKVNRTIVGRLLGMAGYGENSVTLWKVSLLPNMSIALSLLYTVFVVLFAMAAVVNVIGKKQRDELLDQEQWSKIMKCRVGCNIAIGYIPIVVYFINIIIGK